MTDVDKVMEAFDHEWVVQKHELENGRVRVYLDSKRFPGMVWSFLPLKGSKVPPVGTVGRSGFMWSQEGQQ